MSKKNSNQESKSQQTDKVIRIVLIEDNKFTRAGWEVLFQSNKNFNLVGSFGDCETAFKSDAISKTDMVLLDIGLPGMSGIEGVKFIKKNYPEVLIVMCTVYEDNEEVFEAICAGAVGYLTKDTSPDELIKSLIEAYNGGSPMTPSIARKVISSFQNISEVNKDKVSANVELTEREIQILNLMAQGKSYKKIAEEVFLSVDGVYYHIRHIYEKLQVHSRAEAVAEGIRKKIIKIN
ncbi:MAG: response regulator transcription factor [Ignavibacterium sp.]|nr:response regulator transcription factor [Ignavibacterium sp.]